MTTAKLIVALALAVMGLMLLPFPSKAETPAIPVLRNTAYPVPADAIFVSHHGNDANPGARHTPLRSIAAAIDMAIPGDTIVIREGTYRETLPALTVPLTLQPFPGEKVWLKGSMEIGDWRREGSAWVRDGWTYSFCNDCFHPDNIDPEFPDAGLPDQVFLDGKPLLQVSDRAGLTSGTFFVDDGRDRLYVMDDPAGRTVEASIHSTALTILNGAQGTTIRGLGFAHYSPVAEAGLGGAVKVDTDHVVLIGNIFAWSAVKGLSVFGRHVTVADNTFIYNGMMGMAAWRADGLALSGNRFAYNNRERFIRTGVVSEAAGAKITRSRGITVTGNRFENNHASGLWLDLSVSHATITNNRFTANDWHGLFFEISAHGVIASNVMAGNGVAGLALANATHVDVYNNTIAGNELGLVIQNDGRINDDADEIAQGIGWVAGDTIFANNIIAGLPGSANPLMWVRDFAGELRAGDMYSMSDFNGFVLAGSTSRQPLVEWWDEGKRHLFADLSELHVATGKDPNSVLVHGSPHDALFVNPAIGDFRLKPGEFDGASGVDLPASVAQAIGLADGRSPGLGALPVTASGFAAGLAGQ